MTFCINLVTFRFEGPSGVCHGSVGGFVGGVWGSIRGQTEVRWGVPRGSIGGPSESVEVHRGSVGDPSGFIKRSVRISWEFVRGSARGPSGLLGLMLVRC